MSATIGALTEPPISHGRKLLAYLDDRSPTGLYNEDEYERERITADLDAAFAEALATRDEEIARLRSTNKFLQDFLESIICDHGDD